MRIKSIEASVHEYPVRAPLLDDPIEHRRFVICRLELENGAVGYGLTGHYLPFSVKTALEREFFPVLKDMDARDTEAVHERAWKVLNQRAQTGTFSNALSALDIAMWDAVGKLTERTIAQLLGGARNWAPTYVTFGFPEYDRDQLVEAAKLQVDAGNHRLKMVVAVDAGGYMEDARRIRAVREAVGSDVELAIDANYMFSPLEAFLLCREIEDLKITWFEEPLHANDISQLFELRRRTSIPISAGQNEGHRWRLRQLVESRAVDIIQPNVCYCGGYTEARKVGHLAQAFNVAMGNGGGWPHFNMHLMAGLMNGWRVEFHLGMQQIGEWVFKDPPKPEGNVVVIPDAPGLGMEVDVDHLAESVLE